MLFDRWWVAAHGTQQANVPVSATTLADSRDVVQRLRSVLKFLLGALHGLPPVLSPPTLHCLDHYMLHCLHNFENQVNYMFILYSFFSKIVLTQMSSKHFQHVFLYYLSILFKIICYLKN